MDANKVLAEHGIDTAYYDHGGRKITEAMWSELQRDYDYCTVAKAQVFDKDDFNTSFFVSTVWLGKNFGTANSLLIFETLVTDKCGKQVACWRAGSTGRALELHEEMIAERKAVCTDPAVLTVQRSSHV